jgi:hypothetical protein
MSSSAILTSPGSRLDYTFDWSAWLPSGDTIASHTVTVTGGSTDADSEAAGIVTAWVTVPAAAPDGAAVQITCAIVTTGGREDSRRLLLQVQRR